MPIVESVCLLIQYFLQTFFEHVSTGKNMFQNFLLSISPLINKMKFENMSFQFCLCFIKFDKTQNYQDWPRSHSEAGKIDHGEPFISTFRIPISLNSLYPQGFIVSKYLIAQEYFMMLLLYSIFSFSLMFLKIKKKSLNIQRKHL